MSKCVSRSTDNSAYTARTFLQEKKVVCELVICPQSGGRGVVVVTSAWHKREGGLKREPFHDVFMELTGKNPRERNT
jgi:hypothetical protein